MALPIQEIIMGINFLNNTSTPSAAVQAVTDLQGFQSSNTQAISSGQISAAASVVSALASVALAGTSIANAVKQNSAGSAVQDSLEIQLVNYSSQIIVPFNYTPKGCDVAGVAQPIPSGENDAFVLVAYSVTKFQPNTTKFNFDLMVGTTGVNIEFLYTDTGTPGRWHVTFTVAGSSSQFEKKLEMVGVQCQNTSNSFSIYTSPIETASGSISVIFCDTTNAATGS